MFHVSLIELRVDEEMWHRHCCRLWRPLQRSVRVWLRWHCKCSCVLFDVCRLCDFDCGGGGGGGGLMATKHARAQKGLTALMWASAHGHADCVRLLLDAGADRDAVDNVRRLVISWTCFCVG